MRASIPASGQYRRLTISLTERRHRSFSTACSDSMHNNFTWNPTSSGIIGLRLQLKLTPENAKIEEAELDMAVHDIRSLAEQRGERVPDKKEVRAMAMLARTTTGVICKLNGVVSASTIADFV